MTFQTSHLLPLFKLILQHLHVNLDMCEGVIIFQHSFRARLLNAGTIGIWGWISLC